MEELSKKELRKKKKEVNRLKKEAKAQKRKEQAKALKKKLRQDMKKGLIPKVPIHEAMAAATREEQAMREQKMQDNTKCKILNNPNGRTIHVIGFRYARGKGDFAVHVGVRAYFTPTKYMDLRTAEFDWKVIYPHQLHHIQKDLPERVINTYNYMLKKFKSNLKPLRKKEK